MPVNDWFDVAVEGGDISLSEMDKKVEKSIKLLKKRDKALKKTMATGKEEQKEFERLRKGKLEEEKGKIPETKGAPQDISTNRKSLEDIIDDHLNKTIDTKMKTAFADQAGGKAAAGNIISFGKNPKAYASGIIKSIPFLGGIVAIKEFGDAIIESIVVIDKFFKKFIDDRISIRFNELRKRDESVSIDIGDTQLILSTVEGHPTPRTTYNSMIKYNEGTILAEDVLALNDTSGGL